MMLEERPRDPFELAEEVDKQETVMMDAMPSTIAHSNLPVVQQISGPSSDPFPAPEESHCCPNPGKHIMNTGHRLVLGSNISFGNDTPN